MIANTSRAIHSHPRQAKKDGSPGLGGALGNKAAVYREADTFCRQKGLEVKTLNERLRQRRPDDSAPQNCNSNVYD